MKRPYIIRHMMSALFDGIADEEGFLPTSLKFKEVSTFPNGVIRARYEL